MILKTFAYYSLYTILLLFTAHADTITLNSGSSLTGSIVKESDQDLFIDLGFEIFRIPLSHVNQRLTDDSQPQENKTQTTTKTIYSQIDNPPTRSVSDLVKTVGPATVQIRVPTSLGSGFIISPDGYVITNNHVISGEYKITVVLYEEAGKELRKVTFENVELLAQSPLYDLALLKIHSDRTFPYVPLAEVNSLEQGQEVFAVGSPLGLERSISKGIVSVRNRIVSPGITLIQHTSQINPGNSGGPLFNRQGEVVGVNNLKIASSNIEGIGFAIPASLLYHFIHNRDAYAFDPRNPNSGYRYLSPPGSPDTKNSPTPSETSTSDTE